MRMFKFLEQWELLKFFERNPQFSAKETPTPAIKPKKPRGKRRPSGGGNIQLSVTLPADLVEKIRYDASAADESMSEAVEGLLRERYLR